MHPGRRVGRVDDAADRLLVDAQLVDIRRERDRRLVKGLAADDKIAAGKVFTKAPHLQAREDHLRSGRADVDADAREREVVLEPQRVLLERPRRQVVIVVMVVIAPLVVMAVVVLGAVEMVGDRMPPLFPVFVQGR